MATAMPALISVIDDLIAAAIVGIEPGDRRQHHDEADDGAEQAELHQRVAGEGAELVRAAQPRGQDAQQQRLIEALGTLQRALIARSRMCAATSPEGRMAVALDGRIAVEVRPPASRINAAGCGGPHRLRAR